MGPSKRFPLRLDAEDHARLSALAQSRNTTRQDLLREQVKLLLKAAPSQVEQARAWFRREMARALEEELAFLSSQAEARAAHLAEMEPGIVRRWLEEELVRVRERADSVRERLSQMRG